MTGRVTVQGLDVSQAELYETAQLVGSVFQNPRSQFFCMDTTNEMAFSCENMGLPKEEIVQRGDQVRQVLHLDGLMDRDIFALSGGEKQRICIAGAMLKDAPVVILDEAISCADPENEAVIQASVAQLVQGKPLAVIAHRLAAIVDADQILVIDHGTAAGCGTHGELPPVSEAVAGPCVLTGQSERRR